MTSRLQDVRAGDLCTDRAVREFLRVQGGRLECVVQDDGTVFRRPRRVVAAGRSRALGSRAPESGRRAPRRGDAAGLRAVEAGQPTAIGGQCRSRPQFRQPHRGVRVREGRRGARKRRVSGCPPRPRPAGVSNLRVPATVRRAVPGRRPGPRQVDLGDGNERPVRRVGRVRRGVRLRARRPSIPDPRQQHEGGARQQHRVPGARSVVLCCHSTRAATPRSRCAR